MSAPRLILIWAEAHGGVIGLDGGMPWHLPEDLARFRAITMGGAVIMGRKTWDSVPERFRPLAGRRNIVITHQSDWSGHGAERASSIERAVALLPADSVAWVMGGAQIYAAAIGAASRLEVTEIDLHTPGDAFAPEIGEKWHPVATDPPAGWHTSRTGLGYRYVSYERG